jgi:hypothetical protein
MRYNRLHSILLILTFGLLLTSCEPDDPTTLIKFTGQDQQQRPKSVEFTMAVTTIDDNVPIENDVFKKASQAKNLGDMLSKQKHLLALGNNICTDVKTDEIIHDKTLSSIENNFPTDYKRLNSNKDFKARQLQPIKFCKKYAANKSNNRKLILIGTEEDINSEDFDRDVTLALKDGLEKLGSKQLDSVGIDPMSYQISQWSFPHKSGKEDWISNIIESRDKQGNIFILDIKVLDTGNFWHIGKVDRVDTYASADENKNGLDLSRLDDALSNNNFQATLAIADDIAYVGTSSCEGEETEQAKIAFKRAKTLQKYTEDHHMPKRYPIPNSYALTLGQYQSDKCQKNQPSETGYQRSIMVIGINRVNKQVATPFSSFCEALYDGFNQLDSRDNNPFPDKSIKIAKYSKFTFGHPDDQDSSCQYYFRK